MENEFDKLDRFKSVVHVARIVALAFMLHAIAAQYVFGPYPEAAENS